MKTILSVLFSLLSAYVIAGNLDYGIPNGTNTHLIVKECPGYAIGYDSYKWQPRWVCYRLEEWMVSSSSNRIERTNDFHQDERFGSNSPTPFDYFRSGYDRGHLCPAADMGFSKEAMRDSFLMTNMSPQKPDFNRGIWRELEIWTREKARREKSLYIMTGPIFTDSCTNTIANGKIRVPTAYYKIILDETPPIKVVAFIIKNEKCTIPFSNYECSVDMIEKFTGLNFFDMLPSVIRNNIKASRDYKFWGLVKGDDKSP